jgi:hypothetical protein
MANPHRVANSSGQRGMPLPVYPIILTRVTTIDGLPQYEVDFSHPEKQGGERIRDVITFHTEQPAPQSMDLYPLFRDGTSLDHARSLSEADRQMFLAARKYATVNSEGRPVQDSSGVPIRVPD